MKNFRSLTAYLVVPLILIISGCSQESDGPSLPTASDMGTPVPYHAEVKISDVKLLSDWRQQAGGTPTADLELASFCGSVIRVGFYGGERTGDLVSHTPDNNLGFVKIPVTCPPEEERGPDFEKNLKAPLLALTAAADDKSIWYIFKGTTSPLAGAMGPWFDGSFHRKGGLPAPKPDADSGAKTPCPESDGDNPDSVSLCADEPPPGIEAIERPEDSEDGNGDEPAAEKSEG